jgi:Uma2 family endonuclease
LPLYANAGIAEVWIVNLKKRVIEIYREPKEGEYQSQTIVADDAAIYLAMFDKNIEVSALLG